MGRGIGILLLDVKFLDWSITLIIKESSSLVDIQK